MSTLIKSKAGFVSRGGLSLIALVGGSLFGLGYYSKHTLLLKNYKKLIELDGKDGNPLELSQNLKNMVGKVSEEIKQFISEYTIIYPCLIPDLNTLHAGTIGTWYGGVIGLPRFFEFDNKEEVDDKILITELDSRSQEEDIKNCFLLSDEAKKYRIAYEIIHVNKITVFLTTTVPIIATFGVEKLTKIVAVNLRVSTFPVFVRGVFYLTFTVFGLYFWIFLHSNIRRYIDSRVEDDISTLGDEYLKGAIEYYSKAIKRDSFQAQTKIDECSIIKTIAYKLRSFSLLREVPLSRKLAFFQAKLEAKSKQDSASEPL